MKRKPTVIRGETKMNANDKFDVLEDAQTEPAVEASATIELSLCDLDVIGGGAVIIAFG